MNELLLPDGFDKLVQSTTQEIVDVHQKKLFGMPCLKVKPEVYGQIMLALSIISVVSLIGSCVYSILHTGVLASTYFLAYSIMYLLATWVIIPMWQIYTLKREDGSDVICFRNGCIYCMVAANMWAYCWGRYILQERNFSLFIPFSIYNFIFMIRNPGKELNPKLPEELASFGAGRMYLFLMSASVKGTLDLILFINAFLNFIEAFSSARVTPSLVFAVMALLSSALNLRVYVTNLLFGVFLLPVLLLMGAMCFCADCFGDTWNPKRGTYMFFFFSLYWRWVV